MRKTLILATMLVFGAGVAQAADLTITDNNSSLKFTYDDPGLTPPVRLSRSIDWTVDGRRILVYPSDMLLNIGHIHSGLHVAANQMHAQGFLLGHESGATAGTVVAGAVYSVYGGAAGSGVSRISHKLDILNKSGGPVSLLLTGTGFKSPQASREVPDFTGVDVSGTTVVYFQGNPQTGSLTDAPFAPVTVLPVVSFSGFNPLLNQNFSLPAGAMLTVVTELKVAPAVSWWRRWWWRLTLQR